jgi:hypothetical protein
MRYLSATACLADQSLIDVNLPDDTLSLHRFFQEATFRRLKVQQTIFQQAYYAVVEMVNRAIPKDDYLSMKHLRVETYLGHAEFLYNLLSEDLLTPAVNSLLSLLGKIAW